MTVPPKFDGEFNLAGRSVVAGFPYNPQARGASITGAADGAG
jgi:hypothetical protein